ncbi:zinc finger CCCH-type with G patch domain-containing protein isoform X2 [Bombina bombina]|nr:zinc finger CCCH-type with G patch domain-containing protein isoform X2 [Bombina bombina]
MDEHSLTAALQTYRAQLEQVELTLQAAADPSQQADLVQLQGDLQQLIELTESSLLSVQKCNLLSALDGASANCAEDEEYEAFRKAISEVSQDSKPSETNGEEPNSSNEDETGSSNDDEAELSEEEADETSGMKVKAPYYSTWGTLEYHNAMIVGSKMMPDGSPGVRVLYLYPTHKAMKPCPYFLDGKCRFLENCRFSHGQVVPVEELQDFLEPDVSSLKVESPCLARHSDGIWYPAKLTDIDNGFYTVKFNSLLLKESVLEADAIIPPLRGSDRSSSSDEDEEETLDPSGYAKVLEAGDGATSHTSVFAGWEAHTRGIGSKLLTRMGYEFGKGLGRNADGRVEPIEAVVLPKGKSLDQCAAIQQKKLAARHDPLKPRKRRRAKPARGGESSSNSRQNVFDFLNERLKGKSKNSEEGKAANATARKGKEIYNASQDSKRAISVKLSQTTERIQQKQKEIGRLKESMARNAGRDSVLRTQLEQRLSGAVTELRGMQQEERSLQIEQKKADTHKKMTEF